MIWDVAAGVIIGGFVLGLLNVGLSQAAREDPLAIGTIIVAVVLGALVLVKAFHFI